MGFGYGLIAGFESQGIEERAEDGGAQQALAHGRLAGVEGMEERSAAVLTQKERVDQFEVADRDLVEFERGGVLLKLEAVDVRASIFCVVRT